jgi:DNA-binding helix-hairpin-helix protein with protein kinase domain
MGEWVWVNHGLPCPWCEGTAPHLHSHRRDDATIGIMVRFIDDDAVEERSAPPR